MHNTTCMAKSRDRISQMLSYILHFARIHNFFCLVFFFLFYAWTLDLYAVANTLAVSACRIELQVEMANRNGREVLLWLGNSFLHSIHLSTAFDVTPLIALRKGFIAIGLYHHTGANYPSVLLCLGWPVPSGHKQMGDWRRRPLLWPGHHPQ